MPKFSIIVPIYNVEPYLRECIDSVLVQTFQDFELILVDDGSPDGSPAICDEYADKDIRIQVIHKENGGLSSARNAGLDHAKGLYIYFLDGDDYILPDLLEKTAALMEDEMDLAVFRFQNLFTDGRTKPGRDIEKKTYTLTSPEATCSFFQKVLLPCKIGWEVWARVFRRELIEQYGLRFADNRRIFAEDLYFSLCYCAHASRISCTDEILYNYRHRDNSIMGVQKKNNNIGRINELGKAVLDHYHCFDDCQMLVEQFYLIHTQIVLQQFINQLWTSGIDPREFQKMTRENVEDWVFLEQAIRKSLHQRNLAHQLGSAERALELRSHADYLLGGSWIVLRIRCKLIRMIRPLLLSCSRQIT